MAQLITEHAELGTDQPLFAYCEEQSSDGLLLLPSRHCRRCFHWHYRQRQAPCLLPDQVDY